MPDPQAALNAVFEKREVRLGLKEALFQRLAYRSEKEQRRSEALFNRALDPQCSFDRENQLVLCALAVCPEEVGWSFKLRESMHRLFQHLCQ
jgi:hypothetical protein